MHIICLIHLVLAVLVDNDPLCAEEWKGFHMSNMNPHVYLFSLDRDYKQLTYDHLAD